MNNGTIQERTEALYEQFETLRRETKKELYTRHTARIKYFGIDYFCYCFSGKVKQNHI